jgi:hypothetical protein
VGKALERPARLTLRQSLVSFESRPDRDFLVDERTDGIHLRVDDFDL